VGVGQAGEIKWLPVDTSGSMHEVQSSLIWPTWNAETEECWKLDVRKDFKYWSGFSDDVSLLTVL
jgi:hypothetical protein